MPRKVGEKQYNSFVRGLITEAGPLTYPENAFLDVDNIVLNKDGSISRRLGIDYEEGYVKTSCGYTADVLLDSKRSFHKWEFAGGSNTTLGIIRVRDKLYFIDLLAASPSANLKNSGNAITLAGLESSPIEVAPVNGGVVVVSADLDRPILLEYNSDTDTVSSTIIYPRIRDFYGIDDGLEITERPLVLTDAHEYNLKNQGWKNGEITTAKASVSAYPSNSDLWSVGQEADGDFDESQFRKLSRDTAQASLGKYILDMFDRGTSRNTNYAGIYPLDKEKGRISTATTYAGRVFYSGIASQIEGKDNRSPNYSGYIFFTKTAANTKDLEQCYQEADPTSVQISDIIDTDGGTINIVEANKIVKLVSIKGSLVAFANNGVWEIFGSDYGFRATDYQLSKVTNIGVANPKTIVVAGDTIVYWAKTGIYVLAQEPSTGRLQVQNVSLQTIQTFYDNLSSTAKEEAKGFYDQKENKVRWLYSDDGDEYRKELILDITLGSFYTNSIEETTVFIADYVEVPNYSSGVSVEDVYVEDELVVVDTDTVQIDSITVQNRDSVFSFLVFTEDGSFTLAKYSNENFLDWEIETTTGLDYDSYFVTGYELFQDMMKKKQTPYLVMVFERTEDGFETSGTSLIATHPSSCLVQAQWNWTNTTASNKWGTQFQAYRYNRSYIPSGSSDNYDTGDRVIVTRNKLRGSGRALSLYMTSETGKDMKILGWGLSVGLNTAL